MRSLFISTLVLWAILGWSQENPLQKAKAQGVQCQICLEAEDGAQLCFESQALSLILNPVNGQLALSLDPATLKIVQNQSSLAKAALYGQLAEMSDWRFGGSLRTNRGIEEGRPMEREVHFDGELKHDSTVYPLSLDALWKRSPGDLRLLIDEKWQLDVLADHPLKEIWSRSAALRLKINARLVLIE